MGSLPLDDAIERARAGDAEAQASLIEGHQRALHRFLYYLCHDAELAQDLCQDAFVKALTSLSTLSDPGKFKSWLFKIGRNLHLDHVKSPRNQSEELMQEPPADPEAAFFRVAPGPELLAAIRETLSRLPEADRAAILLVDLEGYSYVEASEILGVSEEALTSRLFRARKGFVRKFEGG